MTLSASDSSAVPHVFLASTQPVPGPGINSRTLLDSPTLRLVRFTLDAGEELTEHTSTRPALVQVLSGECDFSLGLDTHPLRPGDVVWMPANTPHAVVARTPLVFLLTLGSPGPTDGA